LNHATEKHPIQLRMSTFLFVLLTVRIVSYFSLMEGVGNDHQIKFATRIATLVACFAVIGWHYLGIRQKKSRLSLRNRGLVFVYGVFLYVASVSLLYTSSLGDSTRQLLMYIESIAFAAFFYASVVLTRSESLLPRALFWAISLITAVFLVGAYINPAMFFRGTHGGAVLRLGGFIINPNSLGLLIVLGIGLLLSHASVNHNWKSRASLAVMAPILLTGLILTSSRSSLVALACVLLYIVASSASVRTRFVLIGGSVMIAVFGFDFFHDIIFKQDDVSEVLSMTGRVPFWIDLVSIAVPERPFLGYGFQQLWIDGKFSSPNAYTSEMAHNTFLQVQLGLGVVGLVVVLLQLAITVWAAFAARHTEVGRTAMVLLIPLIVNSITDFGIFGFMNFGVTFYQLVIFMLVIHPRNYAAPVPRARFARWRGNHAWS
jgi:exopolysaccharide production protein ExoQ